jgi:type IV pilus assembly protein PilX
MQVRAFERGMALVSALLLLVVTTILAIAMFRSFGLLERISGNTREKQRALHAAESARTYAEWWLTTSKGVNATTGQSCNALVTTAQVCSNAIANVSTLPWNAGVTYAVPGLQTGNTGAVGNYYSAPTFYISYLGYSYDPKGTTTLSTYQIDAAGYGGNASSAAVAESVYNVGVTYTTQNSLKKWKDLGGP